MVLRLIATRRYSSGVATSTERAANRGISRLADAATEARPGTKVQVTIGESTAALPAEVVAQLGALLADLAEGRSVTVAPADLPVGTEWAAELLGVSRPWLATMLDRGDIPMQRVGSKRRVLLGDLMAYRRADDRRRQQAQTWDFLDEE